MKWWHWLILAVTLVLVLLGSPAAIKATVFAVGVAVLGLAFGAVQYLLKKITRKKIGVDTPSLDIENSDRGEPLPATAHSATPSSIERQLQNSQALAHVGSQSATTKSESTRPPTAGPASPAISEKDIYGKIAEELETPNIDKSVWTRAFAESDGDEARTRAAYIRYRADELRKPSSSPSIVQAREAQTPPALNTRSMGELLRTGNLLAIHGLSEPAPRSDSMNMQRAISRSDEIERALQRPAVVQPATSSDLSRVESGTAYQNTLESNASSPTFHLVLIVCIPISLLMVWGLFQSLAPNHEETLSARAPQSAASPQPSADAARATAASVSLSLEDRVRDYASAYKPFSPTPDDETKLSSVRANRQYLSFDYDLTPLGQRLRKAGRFASNDEMRVRMIDVMCGDPDRRKLLIDGAHFTSILHLSPESKVVARADDAGDCK